MAISVTTLLTALACNAVMLRFSTPTPAPTNTKKSSPTLAQTDTLIPTESPTEIPTATITLPPPPPSLEPSPTIFATLTVDEAILVFYINKKDQGPYGCGEDLWYVKTNQKKTGNLLLDIKYALSVILNFHSENFGELYNPGYAASIGVSDVVVKDASSVAVYLTGTWQITKDRCDGRRFTDQLRRTIKQFPGVNNIVIYLNGTPIADVIARK